MTPGSGRDVVSVADVVAQFRAELRDPASLPSDGVLGLLSTLHRNNVDQWRCEDVTRSADADDAAVAATKRAIDGLNQARHGLVEAIDAALAAEIRQTPTAPPTTESPAMVFDRLSVLTIRLHFTEIDGRHRERLPVLDRQLTTLVEALEGLFDDVRSGRKRFVPYQSLKLYGSAASQCS